MSFTDYEVLEEIESIFKEDSRTKDYTIMVAEDPNEPPDANSCPAIDIVPTRKERQLVRTGAIPYITIPSYDIICWEYSVRDYKDAFSRAVLTEENVFQVLLANKSLNSKVLTSTIGNTEYEYFAYDGYYIRVVLSLLTQMNR